MPGASDHARYVTDKAHDPRSRFGLYRLCECPACGGKGKVWKSDEWNTRFDPIKCPECRGEGRVRQEVASCDSPEAVGVALVTLAREGEWEECPFGLLDRYPECEECGGDGLLDAGAARLVCGDCKGSGVKPTGTWLVLPWLPSPRNVSDAGRVLSSARKKYHTQ